MAIKIKTYLTPTEYEQVKLVNLGLEIAGSSDCEDSEKDATALIFRVEQGIINHLISNGYEFKESDIETNDHTITMWKLAVCDQIEEFITKGLTTIAQVNEEMNPKNVWMIEGTKGFLRRGGFMNIRRY